MENKYEGSPKRMSLKGDSAEFVNDAILNREHVKRFQNRDRMGKPRRPFDNPT